MAGIDRWLHYTVTTIDRFHCIFNLVRKVHTYTYLRTYVQYIKHVFTKLSTHSNLLTGHFTVVCSPSTLEDNSCSDLFTKDEQMMAEIGDI